MMSTYTNRTLNSRTTLSTECPDTESFNFIDLNTIKQFILYQNEITLRM